jgi:hypothetical protein
LALVGCGSSAGTPRPGSGGTTGSAGTTGSGGATGSAGTTGSGGATGSGGTSGVTALPCTANPTTSLLSNFGTASGDGGVTASGTWGTTGQLTGSVFGYGGQLTSDAGLTSSVKAKIDTTARTLTLSGTVLAADYSGGGMAFGTCVDSTTWTGIQFTLGGTTNGCILTFQLQTESQEPTSAKGTCPPPNSNCYDFPNEVITIPSTPGPVTIKFSDLANTGVPAAPADFEKEMFGLQWQFTSAAPPDGGVQVGCSPDMTISDVMWTTSN